MDQTSPQSLAWCRTLPLAARELLTKPRLNHAQEQPCLLHASC